MAPAPRRSAPDPSSVATEPADSQSLEARAQRLIDEVLRPLVAADGGNIELVSVEDKRLVVRLSGMCSGCPGRPYTLSGVVEPAARRYLGSEVQVEAELD